MTDLSNEIEFTIEKQARLLGSFSIECGIDGAVAATLHGSEIPTTDLDVCYARNPSNLEALATALKSVNARLRNAPAEIPFIMDSETLRRGLNFTFSTTIGNVDLLGEVLGIGYYEDAIKGALTYDLFGYEFRVIDIAKLIASKRAAGRPKDLLVIPELEAIQERQNKLKQ